MNLAAKNEYWKNLAMQHKLIAHDADILDAGMVVGKRNSFLLNIQDNLAASEFLRLDFPCICVDTPFGNVINKDGNCRLRNTNSILFLTRFGIDSNEDPSIPASKENAFQITFEIMMDFLNKTQSDYEELGGCGAFRYIDEGSYSWEPQELEGSGMCGWLFTFADEESYSFKIDETKWL